MFAGANKKAAGASLKFGGSIAATSFTVTALAAGSVANHELEEPHAVLPSWVVVAF